MTIAEIKALDHVSVTEQDGMSTIIADNGYYLKYDETRVTRDGETETQETASVFVAAIYTMDAETTTFPDYAIATEAEKLAYERKPNFDGMTLEEAKQKVVAEITAYDDSSEVNAFIFNGMSLWFTPDMRKTIRTGVESCKTLGRDTYDATYQGMQVSIPVDTALQLLAQIECYALDCQNVTAKHKAAVDALTTVDDVAAYDYREGYPDKLTFSLG